MNAILFKYQSVACGILGAILVIEWGIAEISHRQLQETLNKTIASDYQADPLPELNLPKLSDANFGIIVERPLFIEGRKPLPEVPEDKTAAVDTGQLDDWALIGIYNKNKNRDKHVALFRNQKEAKKFLKLHEEQTIAGWQLIEIKSDRVVLQMGGQQKSVMLRKPRVQSKTPVPPKRPAPAANPTPENPPEMNNNDS